MQNKIASSDQLKNYYDSPERISRYEEDRFGKVEKHLWHWMDCDAIEYFLNAYARRPKLQLMDLACGTGRLSRTLLKHHPHIISMDYSKEMLFSAREKIQAGKEIFKGICSDVFALPFKDQSFDAIFTMRFIRHFKSDERSQIYKEIFRLLKNDGVLIFEALNQKKDHEPEKRVVYDKAYTLSEVKDELRSHGFEFIEALAGDAPGDWFAHLAKRNRFISLGRWRVKQIRKKYKQIEKSTYWMLCARKGKQNV